LFAVVDIMDAFLHMVLFTASRCLLGTWVNDVLTEPHCHFRVRMDTELITGKAHWMNMLDVVHLSARRPLKWMVVVFWV